MPLRWDAKAQLSLCWYVIRWLVLLLPVAAVIGSAVALFLWLLDRATHTRWENPWLIWMMPLGGMAIALVYHHLGKSAEGGNNLIVEQIHEPGGGVPKRMAPLVLLGTVATHLVGGSAGREGTAVQMGGSIAHAFAELFRLDREEKRVLLMCGVASGFGAVFGTPLAGAIFAIEVLALGSMRYTALIPCLIAAVLGDAACTAWGIGHTHYHLTPPLLEPGQILARLDPVLTAKVALAAVAFGLASVLFAELTLSLIHI